MAKKAKEHHLNADQAKLFRDKIHSVVNEGMRSSIEMCQMVYESDVTMVRVNGELKLCWQAWGYDSWEEFLGKEMHLHLKTGYALRKVWQVFYVDLVNDWNKELLLGLSKMRLLTRVNLTSRNVESWLRRAGKLNCAKLLALVSGQEELHSFAVNVTGSQMKSLRRSLDYLRESLPRGDKMTRSELLVEMARIARENTKPLLRAA